MGEGERAPFWLGCGMISILVVLLDMKTCERRYTATHAKNNEDIFS